MKRNNRNTWLILFFVLTLIGCSQKSKTPTSFSLTLGAAISDSGLNGGIILMGNNGSERFSVGLTPSEADNFSLELPSGDWRFRAVAWANDGNGMMTGESRCGHTTATIEDTDILIEISLSQAKCSDGVIADTTALDTNLGGAHFKKVNFISCLTLSSVTAGDPCAGATIDDQPGFSTSLRVFFPGTSNFGAGLPSLRSACFNHGGFAANSLSDGKIPTFIRLPFDGNAPIPFAMSVFDGKNCQNFGAVYPMPDGINGTMGLDRLYQYFMSDISINFADNYIGKKNSVFGTLAARDIIPDVTCAPNCYPDGTYEPKDTAANHRDSIKEKVWESLGNIDGLSLNDIYGVTSASVTTFNNIYLEAPIEDGSLGNQISINFVVNDALETNIPVVSCVDRSITVTYDSNYTTPETTALDVANEINAAAACSDIVNATAVNETEVINDTASYTLTGGSNQIDLHYRETGDLVKARNLLLGPVGAILHKNGITDRAGLCSTNSYGTYSFFMNGQSIDIELGAPGPSATHPIFADNSGYNFERRIRILFDGSPEEAFYFNCTTDTFVGAYLNQDTNSLNGDVYTKQTFWDVQTAGDEWIEVANKEEDSSGGVIRQSYFLFKSTSNTDFYSWVLNADNERTFYEYATGTALAGDMYVQGGEVTQGNNDTTFSRDTSDYIYNIGTDTSSGTTATKQTKEPFNVFSPVTTPTLYGGFDMSTYTSSGNFWDFSF